MRTSQNDPGAAPPIIGPGLSQSTGHPDSFTILAVCGSLEDTEPRESKHVTLRTSMTLADLEETFKGLFSQHPVYEIEVRWKSGTHKPTAIYNENCSKVLRQLEERGGIDQLAIYYYFPESDEEDEVAQGADFRAS